MENKPYFCILLTTYNGIVWLDQQINSILTQKNVNVDIYISDDHSNDGTYEYLKKIENSNIFLLERKSKFNLAAKNFFRMIKDISISKYDYIAFSDQDDIWFENKLFKSHLILNNSNFSCYSASVRAFWQNGKKKSIFLNKNQKKYDHFFESAGPGCTFVIKKNAFKFLKEFIKNNWSIIYNNIKVHDWFIYFLMRTNNYKWYIDNEIVVGYRQHDLNELGANMGFKGIYKRLLMLKNNLSNNHLKVFEKIFRLENDIFFLKYRKKYLFLIFFIANFGQFRRNKIDNFYLFILLIFGIV